MLLVDKLELASEPHTVWQVMESTRFGDTSSTISTTAIVK